MQTEWQTKSIRLGQKKIFLRERILFGKGKHTIGILGSNKLVKGTSPAKDVMNNKFHAGFCINDIAMRMV